MNYGWFKMLHKNYSFTNRINIYIEREKVKWKKDMCLMVYLFSIVFGLQSFFFFLNAKLFYQIIFVWEIIMIDKFLI